MVDLSKLVLHSPTPAFKNSASGELPITFSGTLLAPTGASATTLSISDSTTFPLEPAIVNFFVSQNNDPDHLLADYDANQLLRIPPYARVFCNVESNACGDVGWPLDISLVINSGTLTITLTAFNSGGTICDLTFVDTIFTFRYIAYLPTGEV